MPMSDETPAPVNHTQADGQPSTGAGRAFLKGVGGTVRFFAPSIIVGLVPPFVFPALRRAAKPVENGLLKGVVA
jgi:hypothetical protein